MIAANVPRKLSRPFISTLRQSSVGKSLRDCWARAVSPVADLTFIFTKNYHSIQTLLTLGPFIVNYLFIIPNKFSLNPPLRKFIEENSFT